MAVNSTRRRSAVRIEPAKDFALVNGGELEVFFIGVGSAFARTLHQTNFLIVKGDTHVLVDFGMTGPTALRATTGLEPTDIGLLLPTHNHADHVGGVECLALMNRYVGIPFMEKPKIRIVLTEEFQRVLWDRSLRGGLEYNEKEEDTGRNLNLGDYFEIIRPRWVTHQPREIWEVEIDGIKLQIFRTNHIPEQATRWDASFISYGLMIDERVFVSCDTQFDPSLFELYPHAEVYFHDVQFFAGAVHAPLDDLRTLDDELKARMWLMHYADNWADQDIAGFAGWTPQGQRLIFD